MATWDSTLHSSGLHVGIQEVCPVKLFLLVFIFITCICVSVCCVHAGTPRRAEEGIGSPGAELHGVVRLSDGVLGTELPSARATSTLTH